jgi:2-succinyl-5-enolpyruvyl-6-hydroxy-3-cyclohexene-1-carboxylate synthase
VAEAFYLRVPLLILSADRPLGYAGHQKGQVIQQVGVLSPHVHASLSWSPDLKPSPAVPHDASEVVREALRLAVQRQGPVHVNVHLEEPLYQGLPSEEPSEYGLGTEGTVASEGTGGTGASEGLPLAPPKALVDDLHECLLQGSPVWFLAGMGGPSHALTQALEQVEKAGWGILFKEDLANIPGGIRLVEGLLDLAPTEPPGMLLSWGGPLVSKSLQEYLRTHQPRSHWRLDARGDAIDTYNCLHGVWAAPPETALPALLREIHPRHSEYNLERHRLNRLWTEQVHQKVQQDRASGYADLPFSDGYALWQIRHLVQGARVHLGNSSLVRKWLALPDTEGPPLYLHANRGTSGIEGVVSTALGDALGDALGGALGDALGNDRQFSYRADEPPASVQEEVWVVNGDLSTAYDAGAWLVEPRPLFKVCLINNKGGDIFRQMPGPAPLKECESLFATPRSIDWRSWCAGYGLPHYKAVDAAGLREGLTWLQTQHTAAVLEIATEPEANRAAEKILNQTRSNALRSITNL